MTKEEWLISLNNNTLPRDIFYIFYKEHNTDKEKEYSYNDFKKYFQLYLLRININNLLQNITKYYNYKFNIKSIQDLKTNEIIKYY